MLVSLLSMSKLQQPIYLDYHATTPVDPIVLDEIMPYFSGNFGNPASRSHPFGWKASEAVEIARERIADLISVRKEEIYFTSGSTEGLNFAIKGLAENLYSKGKHIITVSTEHHAVLDPLNWLSKKGFEVLKLQVDPNGIIDLQQLSDSIRKDTIMVVAMWANNETGVIHDVKAIGDICKNKGVAFVCDATQAVGKIPVNATESNIDVLTISAHKMYGPKGSGAVYVAKNEKKLKPDPLIHGGGHEKGYRSGTLNVPGIVGLGSASVLSKKNQSEFSRIAALRDVFENNLLSTIEMAGVNGSRERRLPTVSNIKVPFVDSQAVMTKLRTKISISSGSACSSADPSPSHVLLAMGLSPDEAKSSFRVSLGRPTTVEEITLATQWLIEAIEEYRSESPLWQLYKQGINVPE